ncbi:MULTISPECIES: ABC transporter substrate-binding protein [Ramlibacter]|uniref:PhnD/SsuA/transferrin family substrate-binding protein n=1 Tax=Ramlibacter pinisoli TaxID=2682844 RepID=A0A6N8IX22_9BURK|nr:MULTISPECIES: ABC transporter substrate-binding protein [Ramlibacter]MBA2961257.1 ABC transporter substrate-binding protein [Ramlibacter sp. CGMCC 1.13660]MVQ31202.1 PhnD/SsuA/transferrin family substrate-binding protein [Ramlibacter pinisoli]
MIAPAITRRSFALAAGAAVAVVAVPALRAQARIEKPRLSLAVGGKAAFYYLPLTISEQLGYFRAEGLEVEISDFSGGARALQALVGGSADIVSGAYEHTINMQAKNQFIEAIVLQGRAPQIAMGVSTKTMSGYTSLADLRGKKIGVTAPGSSTNMVSNLVLSRAGIKANEVSYVGVGTAAGALAALRSGQIDAMSNIDPVMTMLEQKGDVKIISDTRTLKGTQEVFGGLMPAACLYTHVEFVQKYPNTCQALANAIVHGLKWLQTAGPSDIIKTVPDSYLLGDRALYLASFNKVREAICLDGLLPEEGARTALKALASFEPTVKVDKINLARTYTNEFARRAKDKFKA